MQESQEPCIRKTRCIRAKSRKGGSSGTTSVHGRRDATPEAIVIGVDPERSDAIIAVHMQIDESGTNDPAACVEHAFSGRINVRCDRGYAAAVDRDVVLTIQSIRRI